MTRAREVVDQAVVNAREWERDRKAWNLPPRPVGTDSHTSPSSPEPFRRSRRAASRMRHVRDGLDWQHFSHAYFPARRRHDLEALVAYAAYRRRSPEESETTSLDAWESEGGAGLRLSA